MLLPFAILPVLKFTASEAVMGSHFVNNIAASVLTWTIGLLIIVINFYLSIDVLPNGVWWRVALGLGGVAYAVFCLYLAVW